MQILILAKNVDESEVWIKDLEKSQNRQILMDTIN